LLAGSHQGNKMTQMMKQLWTMMLQILLKYCQHILRLQQLPSHQMPEIDLQKECLCHEEFIEYFHHRKLHKQQ